MNKDIKIDLKNFIIPFTLNDTNFIAYIPQPTLAEVQAISKSLGFLFSRFKNASEEGLDFLVIIKDWELMLNEFLGDNEKAKNQKIQINAFFERRIILSNIFNQETGEVFEGKSLDNDILNEIKGTLLFFTSISRYASVLLKNIELRAFITSLSALEFQSSLRKSQGESIAIVK